MFVTISKKVINGSKQTCEHSRKNVINKCDFLSYKKG